MAKYASSLKARRKYKTKEQRARKEAYSLIALKIKGLMWTERAAYFNVFYFHTYEKFCQEKGFKGRMKWGIAMLMMVDYYHTFTIEDAGLWGVFGEKMTVRLYLSLMVKQGYLHKDFKVYYLSLNGRALLDEFKKYYKSGIVKIIKYNNAYQKKRRDGQIGKTSGSMPQRRNKLYPKVESTATGDDLERGDSGEPN